MALLCRLPLVVAEDLLDELLHLAHDRAGLGPGQLILVGVGVLQGGTHRMPGNTHLSGCLPLTDPLDEYKFPDTLNLVHLDHPFSSCKRVCGNPSLQVWKIKVVQFLMITMSGFGPVLD
jgi:hypothetical protein